MKRNIRIPIFKLLHIKCCTMFIVAILLVGQKNAFSTPFDFWTNSNVSQQNEKEVMGVVSDEKGIPIPGVTVTVAGVTRGVITDLDGKYSIKVASVDKLLFSFVGLESQTIDVGEQTVINVTMKEKVDELSEVTIVAFGKQRKESVISSISTIKTEELKVPSSNLTTALAGRMAGLISYQRSGEPGDDTADFFIRGVTSFGYTASPLILLDGIEVTSSDLSRVQPDDIESFSIMKDATATSLYGARGANGVILVTTKQGKEGKARVTIRYEESISAPTKEIKLADPITYMKLHNEAVITRDPLGLLPYSQEKIENTEKGVHPLLYPATDWYNMLFKNFTTNRRLNFNISGGGKVARYYLAGTFNRDNGILEVDKKNNFNNNIKLNRTLLRSNVNINVTNTTEVVVRLYGTFDDYSGPLDSGTDLYNKVMRTNPVLFPAYYEPDEMNKTTDHILFGNTVDGNYLNPYADMVKGYKEYTNSTMIAQFEAHQDLNFIADGLKARGLMSTTRYSHFDVSRYYKPFYYTVGSYDKSTGEYILGAVNPESGQEHLDYYEGAKVITSNTYMEGAINYEHESSSDHSVSGMLVAYLRNRLEGNAGSLQQSLAFRNMGISGRGTYAYKQRYFLEANFGYNGSERFSKEHRFGFFPSVGLGWVVSKENFWAGNLKEIIPMFKLKFTEGLVGNDAIGSPSDRFFYLSEVNMNTSSNRYIFGSEFNYYKNGISISRYENPDITWETARKTNLGFEMNLLEMIDVVFDVYQEHRTNILMNRSHIPSTLGLQAASKANTGEAKGRGIDFSMDLNKHFSNDFWLSGRFNFTYATSEFLVYDEPIYEDTPWKSKIGYSLGQQWGYVAERLFVDEYEIKNSPTQFSDAMAGDIKYKDIDGNGSINELDMVPIGYPTTPEVVYGFGLSTGYKNIDFSFFFQGLARESFWIDTKKTAPFVNEQQLLKVYADDYWSESNRNLYALWPRLSPVINSNNSVLSTWFMQDGGFLRLKNVELGFTLPNTLTKKAGIEKLRLYSSGTNLLTFSKFKLWDPEMAGNGLGYPIQRVVNFGVQVSF
ncbi:TonB-dependent receptor [Maribellus luteus]|uniref:TonB-dependent receptor n=2 Tax=Maribellus luteus TaxID=2305463 RepID=A0A399SWU8_9BACT|nr:TonB-dependent receptor [Maribellus luteus]